MTKQAPPLLQGKGLRSVNRNQIPQLFAMVDYVLGLAEASFNSARLNQLDLGGNQHNFLELGGNHLAELVHFLIGIA